MSSVRISGGDFRGRRVPLPRGHELRPTSDRARQAYFNIVREELDGAVFLDLFAGTGIFSFEALSRGAAAATAVELSRKASDQIRASASELGAQLDVVTGDVFAVVPRMRAREYSLVYADPPYGFARYDELLQLLDESAPLAAGAVVAIEHGSGSKELVTERKRLRFRKEVSYGSVAISLFDVETT